MQYIVLLSYQTLFFALLSLFFSKYFFFFVFFFFFQAEDGIRDRTVTEFRRVLFRSSAVRAFAEFHRRPESLRGAVEEFEHSYGIVLLAKRWTADINHIVETLELDCSIDTEVRPRAFGQRLIDRNIDSDSSLFDCRIDARDVAFHRAVPCIDHRLLLNLNIFRLRLRDFDLGFQLRRVCDARQVVTDLHALSDLNG